MNTRARARSLLWLNWWELRFEAHFWTKLIWFPLHPQFNTIWILPTLPKIPSALASPHAQRAIRSPSGIAALPNKIGHTLIDRLNTTQSFHKIGELYSLHFDFFFSLILDLNCYVDFLLLLKFIGTTTLFCLLHKFHFANYFLRLTWQMPSHSNTLLANLSVIFDATTHFKWNYDDDDEKKISNWERINGMILGTFLHIFSSCQCDWQLV